MGAFGGDALEQRVAFDRIGHQQRGTPGSLLQRFVERVSTSTCLSKAGLSTSVYYTAPGGFDTHADQREKHEGLLSEAGESLQAFLNDLDAAGHGECVLTLVFSEFGRRLTENGSGGPTMARRHPSSYSAKGTIPVSTARHSTSSIWRTTT